MQKWGFICIGIILLSIGVVGCIETSSQEQNPSEKVEEARDPYVDADDRIQEKRTDFGEHFLESEDIVAYLTSSNELYVYNHENEDEFLVHEDVAQFELYKTYVYYIASDGVTSELDIPLQSVQRVNVHTKKDEVMLSALEEDGAYMSPRAFYLNEDGYVAIKREVGFFYSNYWYDYVVTDIDFTSERPIITLEDEYDSVLNTIEWQEDKIYLLVDRIGNSSEDDNVRIELHSFSMDDGQQMLNENAFPLSEEDFFELHDYEITIHVENDILYIRAVDDDVDKATYEIDLNAHEIISQHP